MSEVKPNQRDAAALALAEAVRRRGREYRLGQARQALLLHETYSKPNIWIAEVLDIEPRILERILAIDGIYRCIECCHGFHRSCMHELSFEPNGIPISCECDCW